MGCMMRFAIALLAVILAAFVPVWGDEGHQHQLTEQEVGSVHFANSCSAEVQPSFQRGIALLHSFQYEQTRATFQEIVKQDPKCAMAYWGVAMSHYHGLWENSNVAAGREAIMKAQRAAEENAMTTARERAYIAALSEIYRDDSADLYTHAQAFERKMGEVQASYLDDSEAAIFHALTLDITAPKTDKTFSNQRKCVEILAPIFAKQPNHPGVAHYIIHCSDNTGLASMAIAAARKYASIAPASAHAHHMPSHIFTRVGFWDESVQSNIRARDVAAQAETTSTNGEARDQRLHAMDYLEYAYLQMGRVDDAKAVLQQMMSLAPLPGLTLVGDYALAAVPARHAMELGNWEATQHFQARAEGVPWAQAITWMAIGIGASRTKDLARAAEAEKNLARLRDIATPMNAYWSKQIEVQRQEVAAWILHASGKGSEAVKAMTAAAELEESMDKAPVTPGPIIPAREMLADLLMQQARPSEALGEFEAVLRVAPNRFNALWGAAISAEKAGKIAEAATYFRRLTEVGAGGKRPELEYARKKAADVARN